MARIERLTVYPIKGLDGTAVERARVLEGGTLEHDRELALFDADGEVINGKRTARVHDFDTAFGDGRFEATLDGESVAFDLEEAGAATAAWFGAAFDEAVRLDRDDTLGHVDRRGMGPSVISTATLEEVASWFEGMTVEGARRRLRANVEVGGVEPFWEDRFVGEGAPAFAAGGVRFEGVTPCGRCVVPSRDPDTGESLPGFRERFVERRRETFPEWADREAFDHEFTLMLIADVPEPDRGATLSVGDPVEVLARG